MFSVLQRVASWRDGRHERRHSGVPEVFARPGHVVVPGGSVTSVATSRVVGQGLPRVHQVVCGVRRRQGVPRGASVVVQTAGHGGRSVQTAGQMFPQQRRPGGSLRRSGYRHLHVPQTGGRVLLRPGAAAAQRRVLRPRWRYVCVFRLSIQSYTVSTHTYRPHSNILVR